MRQKKRSFGPHLIWEELLLSKCINVYKLGHCQSEIRHFLQKKTVDLETVLIFLEKRSPTPSPPPFLHLLYNDPRLRIQPPGPP